MNKTLLVLCALVALCSAFLISNIQTAALAEKCCTSCSLPAVKYLTLRNDKCGESCIDPKDFSKIKIFEPTLELATSNTPCADQRYTFYNNTVTHGFGTLKATLDMYLWGG
jgi:hypothetical protein